MTAFPPVLFKWLKLLRAPMLFTVPGNVVAGWILAGGEHWNAGAASFALSAALLHLFGSLTGCDGIRERRLPLLRTAAFVTACLPALLFRKYVALMPLFGLFLMMDIYRNHGGETAESGIVLRCGASGLISLLEVFLGAAVFMDGETFRTPSVFCFLFAAALCLYQAGVSRAEISRPARLSVTPGGNMMFAGALICYLILFVRLGMEKMTGGWTSYLPGAFSALAAAVFLIVSWKAFRTFRRKSLPGIVKGWILALGFNVLFVQAAAVSAAGFWECGLLLLFFSFCARALYVKLYGGDTDGRLD